MKTIYVIVISIFLCSISNAQVGRIKDVRSEISNLKNEIAQLERSRSSKQLIRSKKNILVGKEEFLEYLLQSENAKSKVQDGYSFIKTAVNQMPNGLTEKEKSVYLRNKLKGTIIRIFEKVDREYYQGGDVISKDPYNKFNIRYSFDQKVKLYFYKDNISKELDYYEFADDSRNKRLIEGVITDAKFLNSKYYKSDGYNKRYISIGLNDIILDKDFDLESADNDYKYKNYQSALTKYNYIIRKYPSYKTSLDSKIKNCREKLAQQFYEKKKYYSAIEIAETGLLYAPGNCTLQATLFSSTVLAGQYNEAVRMVKEQDHCPRISRRNLNNHKSKNDVQKILQLIEDPSLSQSDINAIIEVKNNLAEADRISDKISKNSNSRSTNYAEQIRLSNKLIRIYNEVLKMEDNPEVASRNNFKYLELKKATAYGNLSWYALFTREFPVAESAARQSISNSATDGWANTNLALALLLQNRWDEAKAIYKSYKGKKYDANRTWNQVFLKDLQDLEAAGISHKYFKKVRKILK